MSCNAFIYRFMFYYSIIYSVEEIIGQCDVQQKIFINDTLAHIRWTYTRLIIEQLRNRGQLAVSFFLAS